MAQAGGWGPLCPGKKAGVGWEEIFIVGCLRLCLRRGWSPPLWWRSTAPASPLLPCHQPFPVISSNHPYRTLNQSSPPIIFTLPCHHVSPSIFSHHPFSVISTTIHIFNQSSLRLPPIIFTLHCHQVKPSISYSHTLFNLQSVITQIATNNLYSLPVSSYLSIHIFPPPTLSSSLTVHIFQSHHSYLTLSCCIQPSIG